MFKKFDIIIGNPPYNASSDSSNTIAGTSGDTTLYKRFINKSFELRTTSGIIALIVQRNGIKHAITKFNVTKYNLDTSSHWRFTAGFFLSIGQDSATSNITPDPVIGKTYNFRHQRPFRHAIGGKYASYKAAGKFNDTEVPNSVFGLVATPKKTRQPSLNG